MPSVLLDLNNPKFQKELFNLEKAEQTAFLKTCKKLLQMDWPMIFADKGLKWEEITSRKTLAGISFTLSGSQKNTGPQ